ncbi:MAG: hypothetical protein ACRBBR_05540 [Cellvibrionaceae bacterium]
MLNKHCPSCKTRIHLSDLEKGGSRKAYLSRQVIECPHCKQAIQLPPTAEKLMSIGLLLAVIAAPLNYTWFNSQSANNGLITGAIFTLGTLLLVVGIIKNQPVAAPNSANIG